MEGIIGQVRKEKKQQSDDGRQNMLKRWPLFVRAGERSTDSAICTEATL